MIKSKILKDLVIPIIGTLLLFIFIRSFIFFTAIIPSESMIPTLEVKDKIITSRIFDKDKLKRGDLVVFTGGGTHKHMHVKRIIGLPGDKLELKENGDVLVNGKLLNEAYVKNQIVVHKHNEQCKHSEEKVIHDDEQNNKEHSSHEYQVLEMRLGKFEVPDGKFFFLGDNRVMSYDSRYWENPYIDKEQIVGKLLFRIWPLEKFGKIE
ncbi:signal peptidase I [Oceanirhabdus sp. W0125-5]|uniref:signal peptidase I n=1 Tax=Oceanirhabdus sp. W0125-5 TaxID=2999116 RepID=UPI0022F3163E|nr:signal peptidase I [Oceanirhabdus sp. W0125-5]WBW95874.1 signal peptidase I [Oceanirhabdus sp. W0125-5]